MIPQRAIEKAIEGGWQLDMSMNWYATTPNERNQLREARLYKAALTPSFWQALGKALGWGENGAVEIYEKNREGKTAQQRFETRTIPLWRHHAFEFYDLILTGGDTKIFWDKLLTPIEE